MDFHIINKFKSNNNDYIFISNFNNISLDENNNLILDYKSYIHKIISSYLNENDIYEQFKKDFIRTDKIYINGYKINNYDYFINFFKKKVSKTKLEEIISICSQTGLSEPYILLQNMLFEKYKNYICSEIEHNNNKKKYKINITTYNDTININIIKTLRIINLSNENDFGFKNKFFIKLILLINLNDDYLTLKYNIKPY